MPQPITQADLEEEKVPEEKSWLTKLKELNKEALQNYRLQLLETMQAFENDRFDAIDEVVAEVQRKGELLKQHVKKQKSEALEKLDRFVSDFFTSAAYDHLVKGDGYLDFS